MVFSELNEAFVLKTQRLEITLISLKNSEYVLKYFDEEITKYQFPTPFVNYEDYELYYHHTIKDIDQKIAMAFDILCNGVFIGQLDIHNLQTEWAEIGIWLGRDFQNKGYGFEALDALMRFCLKQFQLHGFLYEVDIRNASSQSLLKKFEHHKMDYKEHVVGKKILELETYMVLPK